MKGLSVLLTLALLLLAHQLSLHLKRAGALPTAAKAQPRPAGDRAEVQLQARTNTRGFGPRRLPPVLREGRMRAWRRDPYDAWAEATLTF